MLQNALVHARALLHKKAQMKVEFTNKLRLFSDRRQRCSPSWKSPAQWKNLRRRCSNPKRAGRSRPHRPKEANRPMIQKAQRGGEARQTERKPEQQAKERAQKARLDPAAALTA